MSSNDTALAVKYTANDGTNVQLDPASIMKYIVAGNAKVDDRDIAKFLAICQARRLNPLAGDAYMTVYQSKNGPQASIIVSKDYIQDVANNNPDYDGCDSGIAVIRGGLLEYRKGTMLLPGDTLVGGWAEVYFKSRSHSERAEVSLAEYDQHRSLWTSKPGFMIAKVARTQALRAAMPRALAGVYDSAEINTEPVPAQAVQEVQQRPRSAEYTDEQREEMRQLCQAYADSCGMPMEGRDGMKSRVFLAVGPYDGSDWGAYIERAAAAANQIAASVVPPSAAAQAGLESAQDAEEDPIAYEC